MRYEIIDEVIKDGRKTIVQYAVFDNVENRILVRYSDRAQAEEVIVRYQSAIDRTVT